MKKERAISITVDTDSGRIRVFAEVESDAGEVVQAELPQRELSALIPRNILVGEVLKVTPRLLATIEETLVRQIVGRGVRSWEYEGKRYFGFLSWRSVKVVDELEEREDSGAAVGAGTGGGVTPGVGQDRKGS